MVKFSNKELKTIAEKCGNEFVQRYHGIVKRSNDTAVKVVNTGMVSSGKSSLFNILIGATEKEHFPTGAARTTKIADYFDYKNISFIDTPGIDVRSEDDDLAFRTIMEADLIIMVHNIKTGPLNRSEAEWLENIVNRMKDVEMRKARLMFVCTWKDAREKDEDYQDIIKDVKAQVFESIGAEIPFFEVSITKYKRGVEKNKEVLKNSSGIIELKNYLEDYAIQYLEKKASLNKEEMKTLIADIKNKLNAEKSVNNEKIGRIRKKLASKYKTRRSAWKPVYEYFAAQRKQLTALEDELRGM